MARFKKLLMWLLRAVALVAMTAATLLIVGLYLTRQVSDQVAALKTHTDQMMAKLHVPTEETVEIDFYETTGISREELRAFLDELAKQDHVTEYPLIVTLQNRDGIYLTNRTVTARWDSGEQKLPLGNSGAVGFLLNSAKLSGLRMIVPKGYVDLKQRSLPLGGTTEQAKDQPALSSSDDVRHDGLTISNIIRQLARLRASGPMLSASEFQEQLQRKSFPLQPAKARGEELTPSDIYGLRKDSVVIICHLLRDGLFNHASGFVLDASGVIVTCYHAVDKPEAVSRGVMTRDGKMYPITEILAADKSADLAIVRINASDLTPAPLSEGDPLGSPVTVISHPGGNYFSLTLGHISRYWTTTAQGRSGLRMTITADFADGSSGAPIFNANGSVTGVVCATRPLGDQMVCRFGVPVESIRKLIQTAEPHAK